MGGCWCLGHYLFVEKVLAGQQPRLLAHNHLLEADGARLLARVLGADDDDGDGVDDDVGGSTRGARVVQPRQHLDEAGHAEAENGDDDDGCNAGQANLGRVCV